MFRAGDKVTVSIERIVAAVGDLGGGQQDIPAETTRHSYIATRIIPRGSGSFKRDVGTGGLTTMQYRHFMFALEDNTTVSAFDVQIEDDLVCSDDGQTYRVLEVQTIPRVGGLFCETFSPQ